MEILSIHNPSQKFSAVLRYSAKNVKCLSKKKSQLNSCTTPLLFKKDSTRPIV